MKLHHPQAKPLFEAYCQTTGRTNDPDSVVWVFAAGRLEPLCTFADYIFAASLIGSAIVAWRYHCEPAQFDPMQRSLFDCKVSDETAHLVSYEALVHLAREVNNPNMIHVSEQFAMGYFSGRTISGLQRAQNEFMTVTGWPLWRPDQSSLSPSIGLTSLRARYKQAKKVLKAFGVSMEYEDFVERFLDEVAQSAVVMVNHEPVSAHQLERVIR